MIKIVNCTFSRDFEELNGSPRLSLSRDIAGIEVVAQFKCAWADRIQLAKEFVGYTEVYGGYGVYHWPHRYSSISELLVATDIDIEPFGKIAALTDNRFASYTSAVLTVKYRIPQIETSEAYGGAVEISEQIHGASEFITLPAKNLYWGTGGNKVPLDDFDAPATINHMLEWIYTIRNARILPDVTPYQNKVNNYPCRSSSLGMTFPGGTLFCGEPAISKETSFDGVKFEMVLRFLYKNNGTLAAPKGWNWFPRSSNPGSEVSWERVTDGTYEKNFYKYADFRDLVV